LGVGWRLFIIKTKLIRNQQLPLKTPIHHNVQRRRRTEARFVPPTGQHQSAQHLVTYILTGLLAPVFDPVGKGLGTVLSPVGYGVSTVAKPLTDAVGGITKPALAPLAGKKDEKMEVLGGKNKDSYKHGKDSVGGELQTGDNPLGLEQTGKFGFEE